MNETQKDVIPHTFYFITVLLFISLVYIVKVVMKAPFVSMSKIKEYYKLLKLRFEKF